MALSHRLLSCFNKITGRFVILSDYRYVAASHNQAVAIADLFGDVGRRIEYVVTFEGCGRSHVVQVWLQSSYPADS